SLVLLIRQGNRCLLLPGDIEPPGIEPIIALHRPPDGGVLMAPHHGSLAMDAGPFLHWSQPCWVIVSGGERADRPEVKSMLSVVGSRVISTTEAGAIRVRMHADGSIETRSYLDDPW
ncbi:MAG: competence protein ComEC, partial [Planctomycetota bacterium]